MSVPEGPVPMAQQEFMERLEAGIRTLPPQRVQEIQEDIRRHFDEGKDGGLPEDRLAQMLGDPDALAGEYMAIYREEQPPEEIVAEEMQGSSRSGRSMAGKIGAGVGMFFLDICLGIPLWAVLGAVWIVIACGFVIALAGMLDLVLMAVDWVVPLSWVNVDYPLIGLFGGIFCVSLGGLMILGLRRYNALLRRLWAGYMSMHRHAVMGREQA